MESTKELEERYDKLPQAVKDLLYSPQMSFIIQQIGKKYQLHIDQIDILNSEAGQVMMGYTSTEEFPDSLAHGLSVEISKAQAIAADISEQLFSKIRASMGLPSGAGMPGAVSYAPKPAPADPMPAAVTSSTPSVVMPSSIAPSAPSASVPPQAPVAAAASAPTPAAASAPAPTAAPTPVPTPTSAPKPAAMPNLGAAEAILSEKKVTPPAPAAPAAASAPKAAPAASAAAPVPKADPTQPQPYKADPYREPVE